MSENSASNVVNDPLLKGYRLVEKSIADSSNRLLAQSEFLALLILGRLLEYFYKWLLYNSPVNIEVELVDDLLNVFFNDRVCREHWRLVIVS